MKPLEAKNQHPSPFPIRYVCVLSANTKSQPIPIPQPHPRSTDRGTDNAPYVQRRMEEPELPDYYGDLGIEPHSSVQEIKRAFRRLAKLHHPDKQALGKCVDAKEFRKIKEAEEKLCDESTRREYDQFYPFIRSQWAHYRRETDAQQLKEKLGKDEEKTQRRSAEESARREVEAEKVRRAAEAARLATLRAEREKLRAQKEREAEERSREAGRRAREHQEREARERLQRYEDMNAEREREAKQRLWADKNKAAEARSRKVAEQLREQQEREAKERLVQIRVQERLETDRRNWAAMKEQADLRGLNSVGIQSPASNEARSVFPAKHNLLILSVFFLEFSIAIFYSACASLQIWRRFMQSILLLSLAAGFVEAGTTFSPNCTLPSSTVNVVYSSSVRGTLDILWSSLYILFACTWSVQHLNVPDQKPTGIPGIWEAMSQMIHGKGTDPFKLALRWAVADVWPKTKWMIFTLLVPEFLVGKGLHDLQHARKLHKDLKALADKDRVEWTLAHAYYVIMGGVVGRCQPTTNLHNQRSNASRESQTVPQEDTTRNPVDTQAQGRLQNAPNQDIRLVMNLLQIAREQGFLVRLPNISQAEIKAKSKFDAFAKTTAVWQVSWLTVQCAVRAHRQLPVTQLEIAVLAFSVCTIITYLLYWSKPQGVQTPHYIDVLATVEQVVEAAGSDQYISSWFSERKYHRSTDRHKYRLSTGRHIPNDYESSQGQGDPAIDLAIVLGLTCADTIFGALHCLAWNFHFPSPIEAVLWRVSAVTSTAFPLLCVAISFVLVVLVVVTRIIRKRNDGKTSDRPMVFLFLTYPFAIGYILARLYLTVEIFRSLFYLPPEAFVATWAAGVPHIG
ncbi:hypothetical protein MMC13_007817 [Lambiella insularis]|nr:hypothetical protein [Lambiella insularis]